MNLNPPPQLGRGIVIAPVRSVPAAWASCPEVIIDGQLVADPTRLRVELDSLHSSWVRRKPVVVRWDVTDAEIPGGEVYTDPPWSLGPAFLFPFERLRFLCFTNNYDSRDGTPIWWWGRKARSVGAADGGAGDVTLPDGTAVWIDGGPREPIEGLDLPIIHGETIETGRTTVLASRSAVPSDLAPDQADAVAHGAGAARIIAPAGSGKTRTLAARLQHLLAQGVEPELITAVAYNSRAADELRQRTGAHRSTVRTIHSLGWEILKENHGDLELIGEPEVRNLLGGLVIVPRRANADPMGPYLEALEQVRAGLRNPEEVEAERDDVDGLAHAFDLLRKKMYARGRVDHGEQVYGAIEALLTNPALRASWQSRCRHLLVDEFQDLTPAYLLLLRLVASPQLEVFGVGDDDQVIYGHAGADPAFLIDFDHFFPGAGAHALEINYRCDAEIVGAARHLLSYNRRRIDKTIEAHRTTTSGGGLVVERLRDDAMAERCAQLVSEWIATGESPGSIAVLTRVNSALIPVKAALVELSIPTTDLLSAPSLRRTTLRALFAWMRLAVDPNAMDRTDLMEAVRRPGRGLNRLATELIQRRTLSLGDLQELATRLDARQAGKWEAFCGDVARVAATATLGDAWRLVTEVISDIGLGASAHTLDSGRNDASRSSHFDDVVAVRRAASLHRDLTTFVEWLEASVASPSATDGVVLSSIHRVKGMEWPRVVVFGADQGSLPHDLAADIEEERRIFHVAVTRAADHVTVISDRARPSRFLAELDGSAPRDGPAPVAAQHARSVPARQGPGPTFSIGIGARVRVHGGHEGTISAVDDGSVTVLLDTGAEMDIAAADVLQMLTPPGSKADAALYDALKAWRLDTSRRLGVPAFVVFNNVTLEEIAAAKPRTEPSLLEISGIGARKLEDYGDDILAIVAEHTG